MPEQPGAIDYSWTHPNPAQLPASVVGVCRYLTGGGAKQLDRAEVDMLHGFGLWVLLNYEETAGAAQAGYPRGVQDGYKAGLAALQLGAPTSCIIHPSIDFDVVSDKQLAAVLDYLRGFGNASGYGTGCYAEYLVIPRAAAAGLLTTGKGWQTYAWSGGDLAPRAALYQYLNGQQLAGGTVDFNRVIDVNALGVWRPNERTTVDYIAEDPRGGWWAIAPGLASKTGLNSMDTVNRLRAAGAVDLTGMDATQLDAITQIGVPSPDAAFVAQHVDATTAAVKALPGGGADHSGLIDLSGTFRLTQQPPA